MSNLYTCPGVYVNEVPSGVVPIGGVATSIAAFVDWFQRGPMYQAVTIQSMDDFNRIFGGLHSQSESSYGIAQFFQNGGSQAVVVRVGKLSGTTPSTYSASSDAGVAYAAIGGMAPGTDAHNVSVVPPQGTAPTAWLFTLAATSPGTWGNHIYITVTPTVTTTTDSASQTTKTTCGFSLIVTLKDSNDTTVLANENFNNLSLDSTKSNFYVNVINATSQLVRVVANARPASPLIPPIICTTTTPAQPLKLNSLASGTYANPAPGLTNFKNANAAGSDPKLPKAWTDDYAIIETALNQVDLFNILCMPLVAFLPDSVRSDIYGNVATYLKTRRAFMIIDPPPSQDEINARTPDLYTSSAPSPGYLTTTSGLAPASSPTNMITCIQNHSPDSNSAMYYPRVQCVDPLSGNAIRTFGPSGALAGVYSRIDASRGVWKAPAGTEASLLGVYQLQYKMTDNENGSLNQLGVNCLRSFPIYGNVAWGARTTAGADDMPLDWKYLSVRRFTLYLEESLYRGTKWVVFEPNAEPLWAKIRLNVRAFMLGLYKQGAFAGSSPDQAFFVKCDATTTPPSAVDGGIVNIQVGFAPLEPAEFVVINIQQMIST